jgi:hypothetical protein
LALSVPKKSSKTYINITVVAMTSNLKIENLHVEGNTLCLKFYPLGCCVSNLVEIRLLKKFSTLYLKDVFIFTKVVIML